MSGILWKKPLISTYHQSRDIKSSFWPRSENALLRRRALAASIYHAHTQTHIHIPSTRRGNRQPSQASRSLVYVTASRKIGHERERERDSYSLLRLNRRITRRLESRRCFFFCSFLGYKLERKFRRVIYIYRRAILIFESLESFSLSSATLAAKLRKPRERAIIHSTQRGRDTYNI